MRQWPVIKWIVSSLWLAASCFGDELVPPVVIPDVPVASIVVTDSHGLPITDEVGYGQQIVISAEKAVRGKGPLSLIMIVEPQMQQFTTPDGSIVVITTPMADVTINLMQIVALGDKAAYQKLKIRCGKGSLPPPGPTPDPKPDPKPDPSPTPTPGPTAKALFLATYRDPLTPNADIGMTLTAFGLWEQFREHGHQFRHYTPSTTEEMGKKAKADAIKQSLPPPGAALVIYELSTGKWIDTIPLPKSSELAATVAKYSTLGVKP